MKISPNQLWVPAILLSGAVAASGDFVYDAVQFTMDANAASMSRAEAFSAGFVSVDLSTGMVDVDLPENGGDYDFWGVKAMAGVFTASEEGSQFGGYVSYEYNSLTWNPESDLGGASFAFPDGTLFEGWEETERPTVGVTLSRSFTESVSAVLLGTFTWSQASGVSYGGAVTSPETADAENYAVGGGLRWNGENLSIGAGVIYRANILDSESWLPLIMIDWQVTEHLLLRASDGVYAFYDFGADGGNVLEAGVRYYNEQYDIGVSGSAEPGIPSAGLGEMAAEDEGIEVVIAYTYTMGNGLYLRPHVSSIVSRDVELRNADGQVAMFELSAGYTVGLEAGLRF